ncbi:MAG: DUF763 domain-containing protein [Deltaproteobacteria bacterium]|nr:DUF763 domain-containing protein [Deltaproteobacteria bacterium]
MGRPTGRADLPLHGGRVPPWLAQRMARLGRVVVEALVLHYGRQEVLRRLAHPFWFQSLGAVMGMDWHSSGITTSVVGALKRGLADVADDLGLWVCGGRGKHSLRTPEELRGRAEQAGLDGDALVRTSRLVAKVDNTAVQDGFQIYLHAFIVAADGQWVVVQQGMSDARGQARRYHWLSEGITSFLDDPHAGIDGEGQGVIVNLADRRAARARDVGLELVGAGPDVVLAQLRAATGRPAAAPRPQADLPHLVMPEHHDVRPEDVVDRRLFGALAAAEAAAPEDFEALLLTPGLGPRTVAALALVSEVVHGAPSRFTDPARFSMAHGGKDGHPFPVPLKVYDKTLEVYRDAIHAAKLGQDDKLDALKRLDAEARRLEAYATGPVTAAYMAEERRRSHQLGGRTVMGWAPPSGAPLGPGVMPRRSAAPKKARGARQLALPGLGE